MTAALLFGLLFMPLCATAAGLVLWFSSGEEELEDERLVREFSLIFAIAMLVLWQGGKTHTARLYLDPLYRIQTELDANPVYNAVKVLPSDHKLLHDFLVLRMAQEVPLSEALQQARPLLTGLVTQRLGFADQTSHVIWARVVRDSLSELQAVNPQQCYRMMRGQWQGAGFSAANQAVFQQAVLAVFESAIRGINNERTPGEQSITFEQAAREFHVIHDGIEQQFGEDVERKLARKQFAAEASPEEQVQLCAARIAQLDAMLQRPQAMASRLLDSVLR